MYKFQLLLLSGLFFMLACTTAPPKKLPKLGRHNYIETDTGIDTIFHTVKPFSFLNQDSVLITNESYANKIYITDFFFTSCPSICPAMKIQMLRIHEKYKNNPSVGILSHTIDPEYDDVAMLHDYAERLDVSNSNWDFVTGVKDSIYHAAQTSYYVGVRDDGSFEHSGKFVLVDKEQHLRGFYEGTDKESVDILLQDIETLLKEYNNQK
jgi:protein SCO1/2